MKRRMLIAPLEGAVIASPHAARAQPLVEALYAMPKATVERAKELIKP